MNKKLIAMAFGLASLVSGCVNSYRSNEEQHRDTRKYEQRYDRGIDRLIEPPNYVIPRYRKH